LVSAKSFRLLACRRYHAQVLAHYGRRLIEATVGVFACLGFCFVPLGRHTGLEHARAIMSTPAASAAVHDLTQTALNLREQALEWLTTTARELGSSATAEQAPQVTEPVPAPPRLRGSAARPQSSTTAATP
jgi:hypothetical protein